MKVKKNDVINEMKTATMSTPNKRKWKEFHYKQKQKKVYLSANNRKVFICIFNTGYSLTLNFLEKYGHLDRYVNIDIGGVLLQTSNIKSASFISCGGYTKTSKHYQYL